MKKLYLLCLALCFLVLYGCSNDSAGPTQAGGFGGGTNGGGNTGGGGGGVTFTVALKQDQQQQTYFEFTPSTAVVINSITANCPEAGVTNEQVTDDGTTVYDANDPAYVGPLTGLAQGQHWSFTIEGKIGSSTGTAYTATTNFTVQ